MFNKLKAMRRTEAGLFNIWKQTETINCHQKKTETKFNFHKWCIFKIVRYETDMDYFKK